MNTIIINNKFSQSFMKKYFILAASAAIVLGACSKNEVNVNETADNAVAFGVYVPRTTVTKAGTAGIISTAQTLAASGGFGIFAFHTDGANYASAAIKPNFMYNQHVTGTDVATPVWSYSPVKYWPNEFGTNAASTNVDRLTFFAYGPYVEVTPGTGAPTASPVGQGITALSSNADTGDPFVSYEVAGTDPAGAVDLVWGVASTTDASAIQNGPTLVAGKPYIDMTKQTTGGKVTFNFRHALTGVGINVQAFFDDVNDPAAFDDVTSGTLEAETKITIESVTLSGFDYYATGDLNLNNTTANTPLWQNLPTAGTSFPITGAIAASLKDSGNAELQTVAGVTGTKVNLITGAAPAATDPYYMLIPTGNNTDNVNVEIVYYVTTEDNNLADGFSRVQNDIKKESITLQLVAGKKNTLNLVLGMTTVKVDATVTDWENGNEADVDLPINKTN